MAARLIQSLPNLITEKSTGKSKSRRARFRKAGQNAALGKNNVFSADVIGADAEL